jgi:hypothetical protein
MGNIEIAKIKWTVQSINQTEPIADNNKNNHTNFTCAGMDFCDDCLKILENSVLYHPSSKWYI